MGPRAGLSTVLLAGALVLVVAIAVGNSMGNRVLGQVASRTPDFTMSPVPTPSTTAVDDAASRALWKRHQVLSVATDPAFPDPRITPEPQIPATARPVPRTSPTPAPSPSPTQTPRPKPATYTSPPLLIPMKSHAHDGDATPPPDDGSPAAPASGAPGAP